MTDLDLGMNDNISEPLVWDDQRKYDRGKVMTEAELEAPSPATHATFRVVKAGEAVCQRILVSNRVFEDHNYCLRHFSASV